MPQSKKQNPSGPVVSTIRIDINERGITTGLDGKRSPLACEMAAYLGQCAVEYVRQNNVDNQRKLIIDFVKQASPEDLSRLDRLVECLELNPGPEPNTVGW